MRPQGLTGLVRVAACVTAWTFVAAGATTQPVLAPARLAFDCSNTALVVRITSSTPPIALRTTDVASSDGKAVAWTINWDKPQASEAALNESQSSGTLKGSCPRYGTFQATIDVALKPADASKPIERVAAKLTLERLVDPVLEVPAALGLRADLDLLGYVTEVSPFTLSEMSHGGRIQGLSITGGELKQSGESISITLLPAFRSREIAPGESVQVMSTLTSVPGPGTYTTRLTVHSPSLRADQNIDVTLKVRRNAVILMVLLFLGIVVGLLINDVIAKRRVLGAALLEGTGAVEALRHRAGQVKDRAAKQEMLAVAALLYGVVIGARTAKESQDAVAQALQRADAIEKEAAKAIEDTRGRYQALRVMFKAGGFLDSTLSAQLTSLTAVLDRIFVALDGGQHKLASNLIGEFEADLPGQLHAALRPWLIAMWTELHALGPWKEAAREPESTRLELLAAIRAVLELRDPARMLEQANGLASKTRDWIERSARQGMAEVFGAAARAASKSGSQELADALAACADFLLVERIVGADLVSALRELCEVRRKAERKLLAASASSQAVADLLHAGDFVGAAQQAAARPPAAAPEAAVTMGVPRPEAAPFPESWFGQLLFQDSVQIGEAATVRIAWMSKAHPEGQAAWRCEPAAAAAITPQADESVSVVAKVDGFFTIRATFANGYSLTTMAYAGSVDRSPFAARVARQMKSDNVITSIFTVALTACVGYLVFAGTWFGTPGDLFAAFSWGFFGQFGLDRIRDLTRPIVAKPLP